MVRILKRHKSKPRKYYSDITQKHIRNRRAKRRKRL